MIQLKPESFNYSDVFYFKLPKLAKKKKVFK